MKSRTIVVMAGLVAAAMAAVGLAAPASAAPALGSGAKCAATVPSQAAAMNAAPAKVTVDIAADDAIAQIKAAQDTYTGSRPASSPNDAKKMAGTGARLCLGANRVGTNSVASGSGWAYLSNLYNYGQNTNSWCGEATIAEMSATVPGPSPLNLDQHAVAQYLNPRMDENSLRNAGTSTDQMVNGLNHYVGMPDFGWNFYTMVFMSDNPTASERSTFLQRVQWDIGSYNSPVAGDAYEVQGHSHLVGHPNQTILHWFAIGGWNTNTSQIWYTDSAWTVWNIPTHFNWFDMYTLETILGGRGYVW